MSPFYDNLTGKIVQVCTDSGPGVLPAREGLLGGRRGQGTLLPLLSQFTIPVVVCCNI